MRIQGRLSAWSRPVKMTFLTGRGVGLCTPTAFCIWWRSWTGRRAMSWRGGCRTPWIRVSASRHCPSTRHARRSETVSTWQTCPTAWRRRVGLRSFPGRFLQDRDVQSLVGDQPLQPLVFQIELFQATGLIDFHAAVFAAPAVVGLFADTQLTGSLADRLALGRSESPPGAGGR